MSNVLFLWGVPYERQKRRKSEQENKRHRLPFLRQVTSSYFCTPFTASSLLSRSLEQAIKTLHVFFSLKNRFIFREPHTAQRVSVLITRGPEFNSRRKDSLGT